MKTTSIVVPYGHTQVLATWLVVESMWFSVMPLPDDDFEIEVRAGDFERLRGILSLLNWVYGEAK